MNFFNLLKSPNKQTNIARISDDIGLTIKFNKFCVKHYYNYFSYFIRSRMSKNDDDLSTTNQMDNEQEKSKVEDLGTENEEKERMEEDRSDQNSLRYDNWKIEKCGSDQNSPRYNIRKSKECGNNQNSLRFFNGKSEECGSDQNSPRYNIGKSMNRRKARLRILELRMKRREEWRRTEAIRTVLDATMGQVRSAVKIRTVSDATVGRVRGAE